jgi:DNA repair protein RadC
MKISKWPKQERPREKLLKQGANALSNAELLAILFRHGIKGQTALDLARRLYKTRGGLASIFSMDFKQFSKEIGLGLAKYAQLQAACELSRRHLQEQLYRRKIHHADDVSTYLISELKHHQNEIFAVLFLDNQHHVIEFEKIFQGSIRGTSIYPREMIKRILYHNAAAVIFAHNHPSGTLEPSETDRLTTEKLITALQIIEVEVLDHFIVAGSNICSLAEKGWI